MKNIQQTMVTEAIFQDLQRLHPEGGMLESICLGMFIVAAKVNTSKGSRMGIATRLDFGNGGTTQREVRQLDCKGQDAMAMARMLGSGQALPDLGVHDPMLCCSMAMATVNALLAPPEGLKQAKGEELILEMGRDKRVGVVGHFPFVEKMGPAFANIWVLEKRPRPGDLPEEENARVLPQTDVAVLTSTSIGNGTLGGLLSLCRDDCYVVMLGPSTPFAPGLFELGVSALAGSVVDDEEAVIDGALGGKSFKALEGTSSVVWAK